MEDGTCFCEAASIFCIPDASLEVSEMSLTVTRFVLHFSLFVVTPNEGATSGDTSVEVDRPTTRLCVTSEASLLCNAAQLTRSNSPRGGASRALAFCVETSLEDQQFIEAVRTCCKQPRHQLFYRFSSQSSNRQLMEVPLFI